MSIHYKTLTFRKFILHSVRYYRNLNMTVVLGIALGTAILTGALVVGDSVQYSLKQIVMQRLGKSSRVITAGERLFSKQLARGIAKQTGVVTSSLLRSNGFGVIDGGKIRVNQLAIWGVDASLGHFGNNSEAFDLQDNQVAINEQVAKLTGLKVGDEFLLSVNKLNTFPANTPFVAVADNSISFYVKIKSILNAQELGNFNLQNSQSTPRNLFLNIDWLNKQMMLHEKANVILTDENFSGENLIQIIQQNWSADDLNLQLRENKVLNYTELISDRVFVEPAVEQLCSRTLPGFKLVFSYFINNFSARGLETPYSFISSDLHLSDQQMAVNQWLADDLKLKINDSIRITYYQIGSSKKLVEKDTTFIVKEIFVPKDERADRNLMPVIPGLSDAGNCRDWKTGIQIDLKKIRAKDEAYWKQYAGTPKAFVSLETAQKLWGNRFGQATAIRIAGASREEFEKMVLSGLHPDEMGFEIRDAKSEGMNAAVKGVDFGQLFISLSFFVLFAAILLSFILFRLFLNFRKTEIGTLSAMGFSIPAIRRLYLTESSIYVLLGIVIGIPLGIFYNYLIVYAINTIWVDIVQTSVIQMHISIRTMLLGSMVIGIVSLLTIWFVLKNFLKKQLVTLQRKSVSEKQSSGKRSFWIGSSILLVSFMLLILNGFRNGEISPEYFFISGFGFLPGLVLLANFLLCRLASDGMGTSFTWQKFFLLRLAGERHRNILIVSFLAVGVFLVVSTGLNRKDLTKNADMHASGTGGFNYYLQTTIPVLTNPDTPKGRDEFNLSSDTEIVPFQVRKGDDASCLNLNRIMKPEIIACDPAVLDKRASFSFVSNTVEADPDHPWLALNKLLKDGVIPAFADQTVIQWGVGKSVGDTLIYSNEAGKILRLKLIGGLANSVFQGKVIIAEEYFAREFPSISGSSLFLIDIPEKPINQDELRSNWHAFGPEVEKTIDRLLTFYQVESTYLNIFLMLGALALLIGTIGLGILLYRITLEQIPEYSLLISIGFQKPAIFKLVLLERLFMIFIAVLTGIMPAVVSAIPSLSSSLYAGLWIWLPVISILVLLSGITGSYLAIRMAFRQNLVQAMRNE